MEKSLNFLGLIKKAGKLEIGTESVEAAAASGKAKLILSASDASDNSVKQAKRAACCANIPYIVLPYKKAEIGAMIGRGLPGMLAVTDAGFASALVKKLAADHPHEDEEAVHNTAEADGAEAAEKPGKRRM